MIHQLRDWGFERCSDTGEEANDIGEEDKDQNNTRYHRSTKWKGTGTTLRTSWTKSEVAITSSSQRKSRWKKEAKAKKKRVTRVGIEPKTYDESSKVTDKHTQTVTDICSQLHHLTAGQKEGCFWGVCTQVLVMVVAVMDSGVEIGSEWRGACYYTYLLKSLVLWVCNAWLFHASLIPFVNVPSPKCVINILHVLL